MKNFLEIRKDKKNKMCEEVVLFQLLYVFKNRLDKHVYWLFWRIRGIN